jgi:hypothetical protein
VCIAEVDDLKCYLVTASEFSSISASPKVIEKVSDVMHRRNA